METSWNTLATKTGGDKGMMWFHLCQLYVHSRGIPATLWDGKGPIRECQIHAGCVGPSGRRHKFFRYIYISLYIERDFCYLIAYNYSVPDESSSGAETLYDKIIIKKFKVRRYRITRVYKRSLGYFLIGVSFVVVSALLVTVLTVGVSLRYLNLKNLFNSCSYMYMYMYVYIA